MKLVDVVVQLGSAAPRRKVFATNGFPGKWFEGVLCSAMSRQRMRVVIRTCMPCIGWLVHQMQQALVLGALVIEAYDGLELHFGDAETMRIVKL
ncbi:hypothetical protein Nepgr_006671 [Nepenthes gracilis]|uniref:Uncharacterized protein n=1 Tax=Nepenthes gracilis TaxID=150966 RepID=A0AAD3XHT9_NEPGR|nr:hypothetical protein Nepgr_006671 [Nepenthes gracilis]